MRIIFSKNAWRAAGITLGAAIVAGQWDTASFAQTPTDPQKAANEAADAAKDAKEAKEKAQNSLPGANDRNDSKNAAERNADNARSNRDNQRRDRNQDRLRTDEERNARDRSDFNRTDSDRNQTRSGRDTNRDTNRNERDNERDNVRNRDRDDDRRTDDRQDFGMSFGEVSDDGVMIGNIEANGIAGRAGIRRGDVIHTVNGQRIHSQNDFYRWAGGRSRTPITVVLLRDGRWQTVYIQPTMTAFRTDRYYRYTPSAPQRNGAYLGVTMDARYPNEAIVRHVTPNSPADRADLRPGEAILSVDGVDVQSPEHLTELISQYQPGDSVELEVSVTDDRTQRVDVELANRPAIRTDRYVQPRSYNQDEYQARDGRYYRSGTDWSDDADYDAPRRPRGRVPYRVR